MISSIFAALLAVHSVAGPANETEVVQGYYRGDPYELAVAKLPIKDMEGNQVMLEEQAAVAFEGLLLEAQDAGFKVKVNYGFRTNKQQKYWYRRYKRLCRYNSKYCGMAAEPGWSNHQQGISVDFSGTVVFISDRKLERNPKMAKLMPKWVEGRGCREVSGGYQCRTRFYYWLRANARKHGFRNDVPGEPWHWTYQDNQPIAVGG